MRRCYKLVGVYFDRHLSFNKYISHITAKFSRANFLLRRISKFRSSKTLHKLYFSLFLSHRLRCSNIYTGTLQANLKGLSSARFVWLKVVSFNGSLLKGEAPRFSADFAHPPLCKKLFNLLGHLVGALGNDSIIAMSDINIHNAILN